MRLVHRSPSPLPARLVTGPAVIVMGLTVSVSAVSAGTGGPSTPTSEPAPSDLSVCQSPRAALPPRTDVDVSEFVSRLQGTFTLAERTVEGVGIAAEAEYHFDLQPVSASEATGTALLLDRGNLGNLDPVGDCEECQKQAAMGALWKVTIRREDDRSISLTMDGDYLGSYGDFQKGVRATERTVFVKHGSRYLAGSLVSPAGGQGVPDDVWDRVDLSPNDFTYVACKGRYIDRYAKVSNVRPLPEGKTLAQQWEKKKLDGSLVNPPVRRPVGQ